MVTLEQQPTSTRRFLLRNERKGAGIQLLAIFCPILLSTLLLKLPGPFALHLALTALVVIGAAWVYLRIERAAKLAELALSIEDGFATLDRLQPPTPAIARAALTPGRIEHARWSPPKGSLHNPMVRLTLDPVWRLEIGSTQPWAGTHGPSSRQPTYLIDASEWPAFIAALTAACEVNHRGLEGKP